MLRLEPTPRTDIFRWFLRLFERIESLRHRALTKKPPVNDDSDYAALPQKNAFAQPLRGCRYLALGERSNLAGRRHKRVAYAHPDGYGIRYACSNRITCGSSCPCPCHRADS